ncbi:MAG: alpha-glucan family phosphorylase [bacterium]
MIKGELDWFEQLRKSSNYTNLENRPIAYFCAEYGLMSSLPIYAGGLGILAGDYVREAGDQGIPLTAVGIYYAQGFTRKELSPEGRVVDLHDGKSAEEAGLTLVKNEKGEVVYITMPTQDREIKVRAWIYEYKTVKVYLLDTKAEGNSEQDQHITDTLYDTDKETRLKQEMVLGIGGLRMLFAMGIHPTIYHFNEGHSAFLLYELIHHEMTDHGMNFDEARERVKELVLFTNHTLVPAGNDTFSNDLVSLLLSRYALQIAIPVKQLVDLGLVQQSSTFSMTMLAIRSAGKINAVSKLHARKAKEIWTDHPMQAITNGIHIPTWDKIGENDIWTAHKENKRKLIKIIEDQTGTIWDENAIILGWARRIVKYKRPLALVERLKHFSEMARDQNRPIHIVFAGVAHPSDDDGREILEELQYRLASDLKGVAVYLSHYDMDLASAMVAGCDVWINTPVVGFEACGTSGMKAALNGDLPMSTRDGWMDEVEMLGIGWPLEDNDLTDQMLDTLKEKILPLYYERNEEGIPVLWKSMMHNARELILNEFSMTRALRQYIELMKPGSKN